MDGISVWKRMARWVSGSKRITEYHPDWSAGLFVK